MTTVGDVTYRVTPEYLLEAAHSTDLTAQEIEAILGEIRTYVTSLEASWQGVAQRTFQGLMAEYDAYARMLHESLTGISSGLRGNYVNYTETERVNIEALRSVEGALPPAGRIAPEANLT